LTPSSDARRWKPKLTVTRTSSLVFANEQCSAWRLHIATSPGAQTSGTASGSRSDPAAATNALMSAFARCDPGTTHKPFAALQPYSCTMKLKPCVCSSRCGDCQCV
jgi:hypothetical protein